MGAGMTFNRDFAVTENDPRVFEIMQEAKHLLPTILPPLQLQGLLDELGVGVLVVDHDGVIISASKSSVRLTKAKGVDDLIGRSVDVLVPKEHRSAHEHGRCLSSVRDRQRRGIRVHSGSTTSDLLQLDGGKISVVVHVLAFPSTTPSGASGVAIFWERPDGDGTE